VNSSWTSLICTCVSLLIHSLSMLWYLAHPLLFERNSVSEQLICVCTIKLQVSNMKAGIAPFV
jgi:hypothetical protein